MYAQAWLMGNLPEACWRNIPERTQETLRAYDDMVRVVENRKAGRFALVRKCEASEGAIDLEGGYLIPGWRQFALLPHCDAHRLVAEMRQRDGWTLHRDRATSARMFAEDNANDFYVKSEAETNTLMDEAHEAAADRISHIGRYFGPKEETVSR